MRRLFPGLAWASGVALVAWPAAKIVPLLGAAVLAIVIGIAVSVVRRPPPVAAPGLAFASTTLLQVAIVLLGATLELDRVLHVGARSLPVMLGTLAVALAGAGAIGRLLGVSSRLRTLVGVGTGICGASAIAAVARIVAATETEVVYAISTIFVFNVAAVLLFPPIGHALDLSQHGFGLWAGTAVNDTSSVVAAAYAYGDPAGAQAVVVKLTRTTLIVPIALALAALHTTREHAGRPGRLVPWFIVAFVLASAASSVGLVPDGARTVLADAALVLITLALAAVGLGFDLGAMRRTGARPLVLGALLWVAVAVTSLLLQAATGQL